MAFGVRKDVLVSVRWGLTPRSSADPLRQPPSGRSRPYLEIVLPRPAGVRLHGRLSSNVRPHTNTPLPRVAPLSWFFVGWLASGSAVRHQIRPAPHALGARSGKQPGWPPSTTAALVPVGTRGNLGCERSMYKASAA